jgi:CBS domain-containing protein
MRAQDIMTRTVLTVGPDATLLEAATRMLEAHVSALPVVDAGGKLVGILSEGDLLRRAETGTARRHSGWAELLLGPGRLADEYVHAHARTVHDLMTDTPLTVTEDSALSDVVDLMQRRHFKRVPVVRGEALVGVVSRADIVRALVARLGAEPNAAALVDDAAIRAAVEREFAASKWVNALNICVSVHEAVVTLEGALFNEAIRPALRVAAENTPGVKSVVDRMVWVEPVTGAALGA